MQARVVIVTSAARQQDPSYIRRFAAPGTPLVCADGGAAVVLGLGLRPNLVVGDLDSLNDADRYRAQALCPIRVHPVRKDKTDTHLALEAAFDYGPDEVVVCGAFGDRADHNAGLLALVAGLGPRPRVVLRDARQEAFFVRPGPPCPITGTAGDVVSLIPFTPVVTRVTTTGLSYPLTEGALRWGETLGVSNEMLGSEASVTIAGDGLLLVVHLEGAW